MNNGMFPNSEELKKLQKKLQAQQTIRNAIGNNPNAPKTPEEILERLKTHKAQQAAVQQQEETIEEEKTNSFSSR